MIYAVTGLPRNGKTFLAVRMAREYWRKDPRIKIYSNFPIIWGRLSSYIWEPEYVSEPIFNSVIIIDEAWRFFNSRKFKDFSEDEHLFFAASGQNENDIIIISQSVNRIDTVIREIANEIIIVVKRRIPLPGRFVRARNKDKEATAAPDTQAEIILWFRADVYASVEDLKMKAIAGKRAMARRFRFRFEKEVAAMYNTHQFRKPGDKPFEGKFWKTFPEVKKFNVKEWIGNLIRRCRPDILQRCIGLFGRRSRKPVVTTDTRKTVVTLEELYE